MFISTSIKSKNFKNVHFVSIGTILQISLFVPNIPTMEYGNMIVMQRRNA